MNSQSETKKIGLTMMVTAMVIGLGLLTYLFQDVLDTKNNPNQEIHTTQSNTQSGKQLEITLKRNRSGHYVGTGVFNGHKAFFLLDTGATYVAIPERIAQRLALKKGRKVAISTANGRSTGYQTSIKELSIGQIHLYNVKAIITPNLEEILLGMSVLKQLEFTQRGNILTIRQYL